MKTNMVRPGAVPGVALLLLSMMSCTTLHEDPDSPVQLGMSFSESGQARISDAWWQEFNDPGLDQLMGEALSANLDLQAVWDRLAQARALAEIAGAESWPTLDARAGASYLEQRSENPATGTLETDGDTRYTAGLAASYEVDLWGRIRSRQDAAAYEVGAATQDVQAAAISLSAEVASTWFQWVEAHGQIRLLHEQLQTNQDLLKLIENRFQQGQIAATDVLQQRQIVEARRGNVAVAAASATTLAHRLNLLTATVPGSPLPEPITPLTALPVLPRTGVPGELMQRRPDVQRAYLQVRAADARVAAAMAERYPRLSITGQLSSSGASAGDLFETWLASLAGDLIAPIIDGGQRRAEVSRNQALASQRVHEYGQAILLALEDVENALVRERKQAENLASLQRQLDLSGRTIQQLRSRYAGGDEDFLSVLTATVSHQALQRTILQSRRQLVEFRIALYRALAGGWQVDRPALGNRMGEADDV